MTSRLKRKLSDIGIDPSSSKANESFCLIGTPLPPLEKSKDTGEFVPLWKQEVRDEKGRRRLHGAFTGGFSAGYFNTVGSKEGWAPSTFVSSRSSRNKAKTARPEDFMDEEDLAELRESRQLVDENDEMDFVRGGTAAELRKRAGAGEGEEEEDSITSALAASLAPPVQDSVGARILKKMGWRMGQGIGPRITYEQRRAQDVGSVGIQAGADVEVDEEAKKHMFPRRDTPLLVVSRKDNSHGLGYSPGMGLNESLGQGGSSSAAKGPRLAGMSTSRMHVLLAGFGLGALNDADEDDLDVYDTTSMSTKLPSSRRVAYDGVDDDEHAGLSMGSSRLSRGQQSQSSRAAPSGVTQTFRDGRPVLQGFVLSDKPVMEDKWFPIPDVPPGWKPNPRGVWDKENAPASDKGKQRADPKTMSHAQWKNSLLSADERGNLLGETPLAAQPRSVFDFMSAKDKERLERIKNNISSAPPPPRPPSPSYPTLSPSTRPHEITIPQLHPSVAKAALSGFQPFTSDPVKQSRYTAFLDFASHDTSGDSSKLTIKPLPHQSIEEFNKELSDYAKAATVFKPLSGAMAGRFRSAVVVENGPKIVEGLHRPEVSNDDTDQEVKEEAEQKEEDPRAAAVRLGMYGPLTREVVVWQPAKLLCKRFGVKEPEIDPSDLAGADPGPSKAGFGSDQPEASKQPLAITEGTEEVEKGEGEGEAGKSGGRRNLANIGLGDDETQGADTLTYQRPAMDVFKAIFASDDEDSDGEDDREDGGASAAPEQTPAEAVVKVEEPAEEKPVPLPNEVEEKIDLATFKPTFIPRSERHGKDKDRDKDKEKKRKKKAKTLVSFDDGEGDEDGGLHLTVKPEKRKDREKDRGGDGERKKKKRKGDSEGTKDVKKEDDDDDSMWIEKPAPEAVHSLNFDDMSVSVQPAAAQNEEVVGPPRGRKRAVDFM
ncbi:hypothetical protein BC629DRAFT_1578337 [Irpex lacteus]|nr:hypothetical protein BC629DRAFT_1578337 [Irpex lacteus]